MKATGVIRRIDDLGRIVIPKEIRRNFKINEGDSLEIFVDSNQIVLKKYSLLDDMMELSRNLVDVFKNIYSKNIVITDKEKVIASSKDLRKEYLDKELAGNIKNKIDDRSELCLTDIVLIADGNLVDSCFLVPIIANSDCLGSVILIDNEIVDADKNLVRFINSILRKNIEE